MDRFFDGAFLTFGLEVIAFAEQDQEDRLDPLIYVFPRMTKCTFHKFGTSGEVEKHDALCLLPLNIVNEKVYIFLWFWFILLSILSFLVIVYRVIIVISPKMRAYLLYIRFRLIRREVINTIVKKSYVGDWFLFYMLGKTLALHCLVFTRGSGFAKKVDCHGSPRLICCLFGSERIPAKFERARTKRTPAHGHASFTT